MNIPGKEIGGIRIRTINIITMVATCTLCVAILISSFESERKYNSMFFGVTDYTDCTKAISDFKDASEYMTSQARLFAINKNASFMKNYLDEKNIIKRRENALEVLKMSHDDGPMKNLQRAMDDSEELAERELYAMKLICQAEGFSSEDIPAEVDSVVLSRQDSVLSLQEKGIMAQKILFDASYLNSKDRIARNVNCAINSLSKDFVNKLEYDDYVLSKSFGFHKFICCLLIIISVALYIILIFLVIVPLRLDLNSIKAGEKMKVNGSYELRYIARVYNELCEKNLIKESILRHKAEHDPLTDLINREAFMQIKQVFKETTEPIAYLLIDIDFFKQINDNYGHLVGDNVLKKISKLLSDQFRNTDYVARVGGDEFAIIMTKFGESPEIVIQRKIDGLNKMLQMVSDGLPPVSLSVGVSFSENGFKDILEEQADKALYRVKNGGRCNCSFYDYIQLN